MYDIIVIGAGSGGLVIAIGAAKAGKKTLLIEKGEFGGDCTNYGCIPSKSLIASALVAHTIKSSETHGIQAESIEINTGKVLDRVRGIVETIRSHEDPEALEKHDVKTLEGAASFKDPHTLIVNETEVQGKQIVIATGSTPFIPLIEGLEKTPFYTNENIFYLKKLPKSIIFVGGGPICCELSQALARLGTEVTLIESQKILAREDADARKVLETTLQKEGVSLIFGDRPRKILLEDRYKVWVGDKILHADALFIGTGRHPDLKPLNLDNAQVKWTQNGIVVDAYGRTNQRHIWAVGDAIGPPFFTHYAENQARTVLKNLILPFKFKKSNQPLPRTTYTDPEIASIGLLEEEATQKYGTKKLALYTIPLSDVDRNLTSGHTEGFVKIITKKWSSQIIGATIVGPRAGEMLMEISMAMFTKTPLRKLSNLIHPYPTYSLAIRKAADLYLTQTLLGAFKRKS
ncbi:dihydrolipoyl dehydrogenase family protein [Simkania sp.]|uniref:dihydrolipoyl dehydrogenase family protein n=1 Tax=Simkania sp. TaxID=34094 RepID=UPI003B518DE9